MGPARQGWQPVGQVSAGSAARPAPMNTKKAPPQAGGLSSLVPVAGGVGHQFLVKITAYLDELA